MDKLEPRKSGAKWGRPEPAKAAEINPALHAHHEELTAHARERHDALTEAIEALESALAEDAVQRENPWSEQAGKALERVRQAIRSHVDGVEEPEGLFDEIGAVEPRLRNRIQSIREDHVTLERRAGALANALAAHDVVDVFEIRREAAALLSDLRAHRANEVDLVYEAFWTDLGHVD